MSELAISRAGSKTRAVDEDDGAVDLVIEGGQRLMVFFHGAREAVVGPGRFEQGEDKYYVPGTVLPEAVTRSEAGVLSLQESKLVPLLVEAVKELKADNDALRRKSTDLETRLARLEAILHAGSATGSQHALSNIRP